MGIGGISSSKAALDLASSIDTDVYWTPHAPFWHEPASTLFDRHPTTTRRKGRWTQVAQNATVACHCEQIDALHIEQSP